MEVPASSAAVNAVWLLVACFLVLLEGTFTTNGKLATVVFVITLTHIPPLPTQPTYPSAFLITKSLLTLQTLFYMTM